MAGQGTRSKSRANWVYNSAERKFDREPPLKANERSCWRRHYFAEPDFGDPEVGDCWSICSDDDCEKCSPEHPDFDVFGSEDNGTEVDESRRTLPAEQSLIHRHCENSYVSGTSRKHYAERWIVNYQRCRPAELKRFVTERGLNDPFPPGLTLKYFYIRALEQADRAFTLPLMDLPTEVRLHVYRPLLIAQRRPHAKDAFHPQILLTNKKIYGEARSILYHENTFELEYHHIEHACVRGVESVATILNLPTTADCMHSKFLRVPHAIDDYPGFLRKVSRIEITLSYQACTSTLVSGPQWIRLNNYLYGLASFLMDGHVLKTLRLDVTDWPEEYATSEIFQKVLFPLRRLRNIRKVIVTDRLPTRVASRLRKDLKSTEPAFNTMRHWKYLESEASAISDLFQQLIERAFEDFYMDEDPDDPFQAVAMMRDDVANVGRESCCSSRHEEFFIAKLNNLKIALEGLKLTELMSIIDRIKTSRRDRVNYELSTDDGRLEEAGSIWPYMEYDETLDYESEDEWSEDEEIEDMATTVAQKLQSVTKGTTGNTIHDSALQTTDVDPPSVDQQPLLDGDQINAVLESLAPTDDDEYDEEAWSMPPGMN